MADETSAEETQGVERKKEKPGTIHFGISDPFDGRKNGIDDTGISNGPEEELV